MMMGISSGFSTKWFFIYCFQIAWNIEVTRKTLGARTRTNNKLNSHVSLGPGIEPRPQWWEASALTIAPSPLPRMGYFLIEDFFHQPDV